MGTTNHGTQNITFQYYEEASADAYGRRSLGITPSGIYSGGYLTRISDTEVTLSTLIAEIRDATNQISVRTTVAATLNSSSLDSGSISSGTPYLVLRWNFSVDAPAYVEIHALSSLTLRQEHDLVIGKCVFSGSTLSSFDYSDRSIPKIESRNLQVEATSDTEMYVRVRGGVINTGTARVAIGDQKVGPFSIPTGGNSRIDLVYVNSVGSLQILQGTAAVSPSAPDYGLRLVLAEVRVVNGDTNLTWDRITDARSFLVPPRIAAQLNQVSATDDITYSTAAWSTIPNMTLNIVSSGGKVHIIGSVPLKYSGVGYNVFRLRVDGLVKFAKRLDVGSGQEYVDWDISYYVDLNAGSHTIDLQWYREQADMSQPGTSWIRYLQAVEIG